MESETKSFGRQILRESTTFFLRVQLTMRTSTCNTLLSVYQRARCPFNKERSLGANAISQSVRKIAFVLCRPQHVHTFTYKWFIVELSKRDFLLLFSGISWRIKAAGT